MNDDFMQISDFLEGLKEDINVDVKEVIEDNAKLLKQKIVQDAPYRTGSYKKGWKCRKAFESLDDIRYQITNAKHDPLIHLLEFGHASVNGGRVQPYPHVLKNYEKIKQRMERQLTNKI